MHLLLILAADDGSPAAGRPSSSSGSCCSSRSALYFLMIRPQRRRMRDQTRAAVVARGRRRGDHHVGRLRLHHRVRRGPTSGSRSTTTCRSALPAARSRARSSTSGARLRPASDAIDSKPRKRRSCPTVDRRRRAATNGDKSAATTVRNDPSPAVGLGRCDRRVSSSPPRAQPRLREHAGPRPRPPGRPLGHPRPDRGATVTTSSSSAT